MVFGRNETWFWRAVGLLAMVVCLLNLIVLLNSEQKRLTTTNLISSNIQLKLDKTTAIKTLTNITTSPPKLEHLRTTDIIWREEGEEDWDETEEEITNEHIKKSNELHELMKSPQKLKEEIDIPKSLKKPVWLPVVKIEKYFQKTEIVSLGVSREKKGFVVFGIPTVNRRKAYYLIDTIKWLVTHLSDEEKHEVIIVVFVAEFDTEYRDKVVNDIKMNFPNDVRLGLIHVIHAPNSYYPNMNNLPLLYGDKPERVQWRSKQSLDYSFLYFYCADLAEFYIQLEDDVLTEAGYLTKIKNFIHSKQDDWSILEFGARGFIGMTYRTKHLKKLARFCRFYFWTMPVDWLFRVFNDIFLYGHKKTDVLKPAVFKHIGEYSSLDGQVRKLEDIRSGKHQQAKRIYQLPQGNPKADISTSIDGYVMPYHINQAYDKTAGLFWGKNLKENDYIEIKFHKLEFINRIIFSSGTSKYPSDSLENTELYSSNSKDCSNYELIKTFIDYAIADYRFKELNTTKIYCLKLILKTIREDDHQRKRWLIIKEIAIL